jgi:hypothetical protein
MWTCFMWNPMLCLLNRDFIKAGNLSIRSVTSSFSMYTVHHGDIWLFTKIYIYFSWLDCRSGRRSPLYRGFTITHKPTHSLGHFWTSDRPFTDTSTWQYTRHSQQTDIHVSDGIGARNPSQRAAVYPRLVTARLPDSASLYISLV